MRDVITGLADWRGPKILTRQDWIHRFSPSELAEIEFAMASAQRAGKTLETLTREDFPLPTLGVRFQAAKDYLLNGLGLYLFRGIPTDCYSKDELRFLYWGIGKHLGTAVTQSRDGDLLADVRNIGADINSPTGRGHRSKQELSFHCDTCDVVGLFCLRVAKEGGLSLIVSSLAIRNEIARRRPDLLETLYQPYSWSWLGQEALGDAPHYLQPIFTEERGYFSCRLVTNHIANAQRLPGVPRLADAQIEALDLVASGIGGNILRHVGEAFHEDPVRILRIARFAARLPDFKVADSTNALMRRMVDEGERPIEVMADVERRLPYVKAILETLKWLQKNRDAVVSAKMTGNQS